LAGNASRVSFRSSEEHEDIPRANLVVVGFLLVIDRVVPISIRSRLVIVKARPRLRALPLSLRTVSGTIYQHGLARGRLACIPPLRGVQVADPGGPLVNTHLVSMIPPPSF
jgi:hypothetical protein